MNDEVQYVLLGLGYCMTLSLLLLTVALFISCIVGWIRDREEQAIADYKSGKRKAKP